MSPILIQRATRHNEGWKMRFGCDGLIATVEIDCERLQQAMIAGEVIAQQYFTAMKNFNLEQSALE